MVSVVIVGVSVVSGVGVVNVMGVVSGVGMVNGVCVMGGLDCHTLSSPLIFILSFSSSFAVSGFLKFITASNTWIDDSLLC